MCCRPCEGERARARRAGDNRKIRRAATYIVSFGMRNTRARGCRPIVADTSFTGKVFNPRTREMKHSKPCHSQENVNSTISAPFAHHVVRRSPSAETRAQRRLQWQAPRRIRCPSC